MQLLAPDVTVWTDGGGKVRQALRPITGAERVAAWFATFGEQPYQGVALADMRVDFVELNGRTGIVFAGAGRVIGTLALDVDADGLVVAIHNVANPDKLRAVAAGEVHDLRP